MIGFNKIHHLLVSCKPTCLLIHNFCVSPHQSFFRGILGKFFKSQIPCNPPILWEFQTFSELIYGEKHDFYGEFTNQCFRAAWGQERGSAVSMPGTCPLAGGLEVVHDVECLAGGGDG